MDCSNMMAFRRGALVVAFLVAAGSVASCNSVDRKYSDDVRDVPADAISVAATTAEGGFAQGKLRPKIEVGNFLISKFPVTINDYKKCIDKGACTPASTTGCAKLSRLPIDQPNAALEVDGVPVDGNLPVTCIGVEQATQYCESRGGRLPSLSEWLVAARGKQVKRYAWGDQDATESLHPRATNALISVESLRVGSHPEGAALSGTQDILLTPGELVATTADAPTVACRARPNKPHESCVVHGTGPGAIDWVMRLSQFDGKIEPSGIPYGFRCVWEEGS